MIILLLFIALGFGLLVIGAESLVQGASTIAKRFKIPEMLIGLTIVALGTSLPELMVSIASGTKGTTDLIIGNVIGSNICNMILILGIITLIKPIPIDSQTKSIQLPILIATCLTVLSICILGNFQIGQIQGLLFAILFLIYFSYPIFIEIKDIVKTYKTNKKNNKKVNIPFAIFKIIIGIILLKYGGDFVVDYATRLAVMFGISEQIIGLTVIGIGTSLPELVTSIVATVQGDTDLAVGNLVGSSVVNFLLILGIGAMIIPIKVSIGIMTDLIILIVGVVLIWLFNFIGKRNTITRLKSLALIYLFAIYLINLF